ncbi:MAG: peptidoglycan editing factor PgeF [Alphaproteobacteria bacterium]
MIVESDALAALPGISHGFGTRKGGVSSGIYATLNCGAGSDDDRGNVARNRSRLAARLGASPQSLITPYQTHSADVVVPDEPWALGEAPKADGIVTSQPGLAIAISTADCVPVLFADPQTKVIGAAHAGWQGALSGVLEATLDQMERLGARRTHICASIGPAISQSAYEVGEEFEARFLEQNSENARFFSRESEKSRPHFDLTGYVAARLQDARINTVENLRLCTYQDSTRFFSYRRSCHRHEPDYGRQISAIMIA